MAYKKPATIAEVKKKPEHNKTSPKKSSSSMENKPAKKMVLVRCPACPWKPGLINEKTLCAKCNGTGQVEAEALQ